MNSERYLELLYDNLEECYKCKAEYFVQDGAPCHTSKQVKEWLENCALDYIKDWPASSPDLNPVENLWSVMKNEIKKEDTSSLQKLKAMMQCCFQSVPAIMVKNKFLTPETVVQIFGLHKAGCQVK